MKQSMKSICFGLVLFFMFSITVFAANSPNMFQNDAPFSDEDAFPILSIDAQTYAPLSFFCGFEQIVLKEENGAFCLYNRETGRFFSYTEKAPDSLLTEEYQVTQIRVPFIEKMPYLPLFSTANALSLTVQQMNKDPYYPVRITDGNERLSFEVLWNVFSQEAS